MLGDPEECAPLLKRHAKYLKFDKREIEPLVHRRADIVLRGHTHQERTRLFSQPKLYQPEWREVVLLLAGVPHHQGFERVDRMLAGVLAPKATYFVAARREPSGITFGKPGGLRRSANRKRPQWSQSKWPWADAQGRLL